ncbi:hypothetical protein B9Q04_05870 [Candidatus Marsarchaeota G2 archaeon BE_D]|jgi:Uncharacterized protein conserved in archaea|uniref:UPF0179 protein B9Q04_05870 n=1 Tax=Candidatus Marsarchaeota G2 archaeon BE_D TaxID=1978158 RepID=A0A2R6CC10_9ARCH|nr:MAG: hypothetical protein B9Q04_05870 [Candidatus Marsarchaeota G2 archaeon BE_D]
MIKQDTSNSMGVKTHSESKKLITLVPTHLAKQGYDFVFKADAGPECETCRVRTVCLTNLEVGVRYTVKQVKSAEHYCALVDSKAKVVEVEKALFKISIEKQKYIPSATIKYTPVQCDWRFCKNYIYCVDNGLTEGVKVKLEEEGGDVDCPRGFRLIFVGISQ